MRTHANDPSCCAADRSRCVLVCVDGLLEFRSRQTRCFRSQEKKKLPGERKDVFPGGVPGVSQGIPPEYMKGNQPADAAQTPAPSRGRAGQEDRGGRAGGQAEAKTKTCAEAADTDYRARCPAKRRTTAARSLATAGPAAGAATEPDSLAGARPNQCPGAVAIVAATRNLLALIWACHVRAPVLGLDPRMTCAANTSLNLFDGCRVKRGRITDDLHDCHRRPGQCWQIDLVQPVGRPASGPG